MRRAPGSKIGVGGGGPVLKHLCKITVVITHVHIYASKMFLFKLCSFDV